MLAVPGCRVLPGVEVRRAQRPHEVRELIDTCPCPVLFAGGPLLADPEDAYRTVADAIHGRAAGLVFGSNIFQQPDPAAALARFSSIVHGKRGEVR